MVSRTSFIDTHQNQQSNGTTRWQSTATQQNHQVHLVRKSAARKTAFVENPVTSAGMNKFTPVQIEEFETTIRY
ncbi:hypothetical protein PtA15_3A304 [Puccinia triticina]|uniref:Uncharacterized protein n=1 Tax=Puccinia triticina TaxID=208348 RepID=A0ABY7CD05_9BASI|nr:uncharacterized protein PtA15_3A304 [Puccinia triticina]WAQ82939.1 hypothetical protein PtA15_3A304 [Puccinia triticina]